VNKFVSFQAFKHHFGNFYVDDSDYSLEMSVTWNHGNSNTAALGLVIE